MRLAGAVLLLALAAAGGTSAQFADSPAATPPADADPARIIADPTPAPQFALAPTPAPTPILVVDQEALWTGSAWGERVNAETEARRTAIADENTRLADELEAEDAALTELRKTLPPEEFRKRADAFDARVTQVRNDRDAAARALAEEVSAEREAFLRAALPVIGAAIEARGAQILLDRQTVFLSAEAVNVTADLIAAVDAGIGAGPAD